jgi:hypothetical protein
VAQDVLVVSVSPPLLPERTLICSWQVLRGDRNEVTFKRLVVEGERRYLKPLNQNWPDKFITMPADARIVGVVVGRYTDM